MKNSFSVCIAPPARLDVPCLPPFRLRIPGSPDIGDPGRSPQGELTSRRASGAEFRQRKVHWRGNIFVGRSTGQVGVKFLMCFVEASRHRQECLCHKIKTFASRAGEGACGPPFCLLDIPSGKHKILPVYSRADQSAPSLTSVRMTSLILI